jgi:RNA polymerase sigma-70 factor, ECF subfamily
MTTVKSTRGRDEADAVVAAARAGDEAAFSALTERYRRELQVHCYRMLGSFEDSEDQVQETFLRAWRRRETFEGRSTFRAWMYRIATNACLDALERRPQGATVEATTNSPAEVPWLQPYPDQLLAPSADEPDAAVVAKETIELAFLVAIQHLPPRPRAVLILRDVLGWSAKETAALLETTVAAVNSALQRARATLKTQLPARRLEWAPGADPTHQQRELLEGYIDATERGDADAVAALIHEDARFTMPPQPETYVGRDLMVQMWVDGGFGTEEFGDIRCLITGVNLQPAVACYTRTPGDDRHRPLAIDVLRIEDGQIAEITTFGPDLFDVLALPKTL